MVNLGSLARDKIFNVFGTNGFTTVVTATNYQMYNDHVCFTDQHGQIVALFLYSGIYGFALVPPTKAGANLPYEITEAEAV